VLEHQRPLVNKALLAEFLMITKVMTSVDGDPVRIFRAHPAINESDAGV
jgi:hypothetical protein